MTARRTASTGPGNRGAIKLSTTKKYPGRNLGESRSKPPARAARTLRVRPAAKADHNKFTIVRVLNTSPTASVASTITGQQGRSVLQPPNRLPATARQRFIPCDNQGRSSPAGRCRQTRESSNPLPNPLRCYHVTNCYNNKEL